jgi:hypothetical protein
MSTSSDSLDRLECCECSLFRDSDVDSGTCTDSGNGEVGRGLCDARTLVPKLALVGVAASSSGFVGWAGAVVGRGVIGDVDMSNRAGSADGSGLLTGRNAAAIAKACVVEGSRGGVANQGSTMGRYGGGQPGEAEATKPTAGVTLSAGEAVWE